MVCHGCHGQIGGGAHIGSATGTNLCRLEHSPSCQGMASLDFPLGFQSQNLPYASLTPTVGLSLQPDLSRSHLQPGNGSARERVPRMVYTGPQNSTVNGLDNLPQSLPSEVENQVQLLRSKNQGAQMAAEGIDISELTIAKVRNTPGMQDMVGGQMDQFREIIPALASAPSAPVSSKVSTGLSDHEQQQDDGSPQLDLEQSEAEYNDLQAQREKMLEAVQDAKDAQAYLNRQQQFSQYRPIQPEANRHGLQQPGPYNPGQDQGDPQQPGQQTPQLSTVGQHISQPQQSDLQSDLQRELLLQQREQQRLQAALDQQRQHYDTLLAQQQQQAALLAAEKRRFE